MAASALPLLADHAQLQVLEVSCHGQPWNAFGGRLIVIDAARALATWDGVFFELRRRQR